jgi:hypothetical protein
MGNVMYSNAACQTGMKPAYGLYEGVKRMNTLWDYMIMCDWNKSIYVKVRTTFHVYEGYCFSSSLLVTYRTHFILGVQKCKKLTWFG